MKSTSPKCRHEFHYIGKGNGIGKYKDVQVEIKQIFRKAIKSTERVLSIIGIEHKFICRKCGKTEIQKEIYSSD